MKKKAKNLPHRKKTVVTYRIGDKKGQRSLKGKKKPREWLRSLHQEIWREAPFLAIKHEAGALVFLSGVCFVLTVFLVFSLFTAY